MRNFLALSLAGALLAGCASSDPPAIGAADDGQVLGDLSILVATDVQAALDDATAHDDPIAAQCYQHILTVLPTLPNALTAPKGVVSAFQKVRNLRRRADQGISDEFTIACGPLIADSRRAVLKIAARAASGGLLPF